MSRLIGGRDDLPQARWLIVLRDKRLIQALHVLRKREQEDHPLPAAFHCYCQLIGRRIASLLLHLFSGFVQAVQFLLDLLWDPNQFRLLRNPLPDLFANPPCCIRTELESGRGVELLRCMQEAKKPLLDEIFQLESVTAIPLKLLLDPPSNPANQPLMGFDHLAGVDMATR